MARHSKLKTPCLPTGKKNSKQMKFNWGTGIFIFYSLFAIALFYQVYASTKYSNDLVEDDYYEKDLAYQSRYEQMENSLSLANPLSISFLKEKRIVQLDFPEGENPATGKIRFYRADDETKDLLLPVKLDDQGQMLVDISPFLNGMWKVEVEWEMDGTTYFDSESIFVGKP